MGTLWSKGVQATQLVDEFTVSNDRVLDMRLAKHDVMGSKAHIKMLCSIGLLEKEEEEILQKGLDEILEEIERGEFKLGDDVEDIHSQVEFLLTKRFGEIGKKIHSGRSRNDQVLVDLKLFLREEVEIFRDEIVELFNTLQQLSEKYKNVLLPGYTHAQIAMPSSFGMWFGAYAEALVDDMHMLKGAYNVVNQNPLGSAAGYGSSFPLDRDMTTSLLGFKTLNYNSVAAQLSRGKSEKAVAGALGQLALTLNKFAADCCMYMCPNFGFISFPDEFTTGSSIMPHKKNPDVFELIRAHANRICALPDTIRHITTNLPVGYFRDMQLIKEVYFPLFDQLNDLLKITNYAVENMEMKADIMSNPLYAPAFSVEEVNRRATNGVPFRDAYRQVADEITQGTFRHEATLEETLAHYTHEGSIGNLCNEQIKEKMETIVQTISIDRVHQAIHKLLNH